MTLRVPTMTSRPGHGRFDHNNKDLALSTVPGLVVLLVTIGARMPGRAVSTGLPRRNQRAGDAAAVAHERQGQGRRNPRPAAGTIPHQQLDEPVRGPERAADHRLRRVGQATLTTSWAFPVAPAGAGSRSWWGSWPDGSPARRPTRYRAGWRCRRCSTARLGSAVQR